VFARPTLLIGLIAAIGTVGFKLATPMLPRAQYLPSSIGGVMATVVVYFLLNELPQRQRLSVSIAAGVLGFFVGAASSTTLAKLAWPAW